MKKNILFIVVDCCRADRIFDKDRKCITPNMDLMREKSVSFDCCVSVSTATVPTFGSILTGCYAFSHGLKKMGGFRLNEKIHTLPEVLKNEGYNTYAEVTGPLFEDHGLTKGFDSYNHRDKKSYLTSDWGDKFIEKIKNKEFKEPWFIFLHLWELHMPRRILPEFNSGKYGQSPYDRALSCLDLKLGTLFDAAGHNAIIVLTGDHGEQIASNKFVQVLKKQYNRFVFARTNHKKIKNKTIDSRRKYAIGHHCYFFDELVRVPLMFYVPGLMPNLVSKQVRQVDIMPTLCGFAGARIENKIHGKDLDPLIKNEELEIPPVFFESSGITVEVKENKIIGLRTDQHKFFYAPHNQDVLPRIYELKNDPSEQNNIADQNPELVEQFKKKIEEIKSQDLNIASEVEELSESDFETMKKRLVDLGYID